MPTPERTLGEFVTGLTYDDIPTSARETVERAFLDTVGVTLAGAHAGAGDTTFRTDNITPDDAATILGLTTERPATQRALHTGTASHALDYDDLAWVIDGHPSVTLVPPILALAAEANATGRDLVTAFAAGFELESAFAAPISPDHYEDGWHATATFGAFGATAAAASLLDLTTNETVHALNIAASTPAGLKRNFGSMTKPLHAGLCARSGVTAARLAAEGFTADSTAVSGDRGFWDLYGPDVRDDFTFDSEVWALQEHGIHVKYYPCCYFTHTSIAGTAALVDKHDLEPEDIERIQVWISQGAVDALHHADPETGLEAKFSMEYTVASAAVRDRVGLSAFDDDAIDDPLVQQVRKRVTCEVDDDLPYDSHEAYVQIDTGADRYERLQENPPGTHDNPLTDAQLRAKFDECARRAVTEETADALAAIFTDLADCDDIATAVRNVTHP